MYNNIVRSTPDNSNLQGKLKKVGVIGSSKQITRSKEMRSWGKGGMQVACTLHFKGRQRDKFCYFKRGIKQQSLINQYRAKHCT